MKFMKNHEFNEKTPEIIIYMTNPDSVGVKPELLRIFMPGRVV